jgi:hypothetical protein
LLFFNFFFKHKKILLFIEFLLIVLMLSFFLCFLFCFLSFCYLLPFSCWKLDQKLSESCSHIVCLVFIEINLQARSKIFKVLSAFQFLLKKIKNSSLFIRFLLNLLMVFFFELSVLFSFPLSIAFFFLLWNLIKNYWITVFASFLKLVN